MRIVVVSAHFPPDFVSGGTLQPQRLADGLRAQGHDVSVYAGWLGLDAEVARPALETWTDVDDTGMPVRWIVTTPYIGWVDDANFDNPAVAADFARHLEETRPDVVHLHSIQSLGAGLVTAAAEANARVVVTMHDFWWICGRQFLVDRSMVPCCPVVDAGVCECEVDQQWRAARTDRLRVHLERADLILCPSAAAADLLTANGVGRGRLQVDENGMPESSRVTASPAPARTEDDVHFLYAGGAQEMKGAHIVVQAARLLADEPHCIIDAYGLGPYLTERGVDAETLAHVRVHPPFTPDEVDEVYEQSDIVLVPSVMRESYSLLTREALVRGRPVIVTDSFGPEEAVSHGKNGLVIPSADAGALASSISRLTRDARLRGDLETTVRASRVEIRSLDSQVAGLDGIYRTLPRWQPPSTRVQSVLFVVGIDGAPLRYRAHLPAEALRLVGARSAVRHYRDPDVSAMALQADVVVVYRVPATVQILDVIDKVRAVGTPVLFDVDDLIFDPDLAAEIPALSILPQDEADLWLEGVRRYRTTLEHCDGYIGSTPMLVRHAHEVTGLPAAQFDNGVGLLLARSSDRAVRRERAPGPVRIGYFSGTTTHDDDWFFVEPAIAEVFDTCQDVELWLGGHLPATPALDRYGDRVRRLPFVAWHELPDLLRDLDVNLAPLAPGSRFNEAKSAIKWLEAALTATPTVASPTEPFRAAMRHEENGLFAGSVEEWSEMVTRLVLDRSEREQLGHRARRDALLGWSPHVQGPRYLEILETAWDWRSRARTATVAPWTPVVLDEPFVPTALEPYDAPQPAGAARSPLVRRIVGGALRRVKRYVSSP